MSDELREAALHAALVGDSDAFAIFNDEAERRDPSRRVKLGGAGSLAEVMDYDVTCPDCKATWHISGVRFVSGPDTPAEIREVMDRITPEMEREADLDRHRYFPKDGKACPAYVWRRRVSSLAILPPVLKFNHIGCPWAWRHLAWDHPLYRVLRWRNDSLHRTAGRIRRLVGMIEQPLWDHRAEVHR